MSDVRPYVIRHLSAGTLAQGVAGVGVVFAIAKLVLDRGPTPFWLVIVALSALSFWRGSVVLAVDRDGVRIGRGFGYAYGDTRPLSAQVPWSSIGEVLLIHQPSGQEQVAVRLNGDAPLPWDVRGVIRDPRGPSPIAPELRTALPRAKLDRAALSAAVMAFGGGVAVTDSSDG